MKGADFNNERQGLYNPAGETDMHINDGSSEPLFSPSFLPLSSSPNCSLPFLTFYLPNALMLFAFFMPCFPSP